MQLDDRDRLLFLASGTHRMDCSAQGLLSCGKKIRFLVVPLGLVAADWIYSFNIPASGPAPFSGHG